MLCPLYWNLFGYWFSNSQNCLQFSVQWFSLWNWKSLESLSDSFSFDHTIERLFRRSYELIMFNEIEIIFWSIINHTIKIGCGVSQWTPRDCKRGAIGQRVGADWVPSESRWQRTVWLNATQLAIKCDSIAVSQTLTKAKPSKLKAEQNNKIAVIAIWNPQMKNR